MTPVHAVMEKVTSRELKYHIVTTVMELAWWGRRSNAISIFVDFLYIFLPNLLFYAGVYKHGSIYDALHM